MTTTNEARLSLHIIRRRELKQAAQAMAECFRDYPLYTVFFPNEKKRLRQVYYCFLFRLITRQRYTYVTDDLSLVYIVQKPGDKDRSIAAMLLHPIALIGCLLTLPLRTLRTMNDYVRFAEPLEKKYYRPETDWNVKAIGVLRQSRSGGLFFKMLAELEEGVPIYCETHTEQNMRLYQHLGLQVCEQAEWRGVTHYVMRRPAEEERT